MAVSANRLELLQIADAVAREQPIEVPVVVPVGPGEDDMPDFDERDLPQA